MPNSLESHDVMSSKELRYFALEIDRPIGDVYTCPLMSNRVRWYNLSFSSALLLSYISIEGKPSWNQKDSKSNDAAHNGQWTAELLPIARIFRSCVANHHRPCNKEMQAMRNTWSLCNLDSASFWWVSWMSFDASLAVSCLNSNLDFDWEIMTFGKLQERD